MKIPSNDGTSACRNRWPIAAENDGDRLKVDFLK